jgi:hypothetical protein
MDLPPGLAISQRDWEQTPLSVQMVILTLWQDNQWLKQRVDRRGIMDIVAN